MAIATLSVDDRSPQRAIGVAIRFALGHALLLTIGAGLIVLIGWTLPPGVERGGEMLGGALLVVMGLVTLQHLKHHQHSHVQHHRQPQHLGGHHSHLPTMVGAAFAVSSLRALAMLTPFGNRLGAAPLPLLIALIAVFAGGILLSMALFGVVLARVLSTRTLERVGHGAGALIGASSVILGVAWVVTA